MARPKKYKGNNMWRVVQIMYLGHDPYHLRKNTVAEKWFIAISYVYWYNYGGAKVHQWLQRKGK